MVDIFRIYSTDMKDYREKEQIIWEEKNGVKDAYALEEDDEELQREADMVDGLPEILRDTLIECAGREENLNILFATFDEDGSGEISAEELRIAFAQLGMSLNRKQVDVLVNLIDEDKNGELSYSELQQFARRVVAVEQRQQEKEAQLERMERLRHMRSQIRLPNPSAPLDVVMEAILRHMTAQEAANYEPDAPFPSIRRKQGSKAQLYRIRQCHSKVHRRKPVKP